MSAAKNISVSVMTVVRVSLAVVFTMFCFSSAQAREPELPGYLPEVVQQVGELPDIVDGEPMSVDEAVSLTTQKNATLAVMRAEVQKSQWQTATAWALIMPMLEASAQYLRADHEDVVTFDMSEMLGDLADLIPAGDEDPEPTVIRRQDDLKGTLSLSMNLINVSAWYSIAAAKSGNEIMNLSYGQVCDQLQTGVVQAFLAAMMTRSVIELQESQVLTAAHHMDFALKKFNAGSGLRIDVVRAEADLVKAKQELLNAHLAYESSRDALGLLTGAGGLPVPTGEPELAGMNTAPEASIFVTEEDMDRALDARNDIRIQYANLDLAKDSYVASWSSCIPVLTGGWSGSYQFTEPASFGSNDRSRWNLFLNLSIPLFRFDKIGDIKQQKLAVDIAEMKIDEAKLSAAQEVREASRQYRTAVANREISKKQKDLAFEAYSLVEAAFNAGAGSSLEVTDALRNRLAADVGLLTSELRVKLALVNLHVAMGRKVKDVVR